MTDINPYGTSPSAGLWDVLTSGAGLWTIAFFAVVLVIWAVRR